MRWGVRKSQTVANRKRRHFAWEVETSAWRVFTQLRTNREYRLVDCYWTILVFRGFDFFGGVVLQVFAFFFFRFRMFLYVPYILSIF